MSGGRHRSDLRPQAAADVEEIYDYLFKRRPKAAERFLVEFKKVATMLGQFPGLGRARRGRGLPDALRSYPMVKFGPYVIFFISLADGVEILRVFHSARDIDRLIREELQ